MLGRQFILSGSAELPLSAISAVTLSQVQSALSQALSSRIAVNAKGGLAHTLPSYDSLMSQFKA
jgi:hypothetical protein